MDKIGSTRKASSQTLISEDEESEEEVVLIESSEDEEVPRSQESARRQLVDRTVHIPIKEPGSWWNNLMENIPECDQCRVTNCRLAPTGHRKHPIMTRHYREFEDKLMIKYLVHFQFIHRARSLSVWDDAHALGYMRHRPVDSLQTHFRKTLLRDIEIFGLPMDLEVQFTSLRTQ